MKKLLLLFFFLMSCTTDGVYDLELKDLKGNRFSFSQFKGRDFIVYVWSGTCIGHVEDLKKLNELYPELPVPLVSVAVMMKREDILDVLENNGIEPKYPILADPKGKFADSITLVFLPATIIFDKKGRVVENYPQLPPNLISLIPSHK
jgi:peroxiredoxin